MDVREKLVELLQNAKSAMKSENLSCDIARNMFVVDFMMDNGVTAVRHGQWIYNIKSGEYVCSACGENALSFRKDTLYDIDLYETCLTDYCPNCGARMDEEVEQWMFGEKL